MEDPGWVSHFIVIYRPLDMADFRHVYLRIFHVILTNPSTFTQKIQKARHQSL